MPFSRAFIMVFSRSFVVTLVAVLAMIHAMLAVRPSTVTRAIFRYINIVIPTILHKIDRAPTRIVMTAVAVPFFGLSRRDVQIDWFVRDANWPYDDGLRIHEYRPREIADIDTPVKTGLAHRYGYTHIGTGGRKTEYGGSRYHDSHKKLYEGLTFHIRFLFVQVVE